MIAEGAIAEGNALFDADEPAPGGSDLHDEIARAQYQRREEARRREWEEALRFDEQDDAATKAFFASVKRATSE